MSVSKESMQWAQAERAKRHIHDIVKVVAAKAELTIEEMLGNNREPRIVAPRHALMRILSEAGNSPAAIARALNKNHTTIVHGLKKAEISPEVIKAYQFLLPAAQPYIAPLDEAITHILADAETINDPTAAAIADYLHVDILGDRVGRSSQAISRLTGLGVLAGNRAVLNKVVVLFNAHDLTIPIQRLDEHLRRYWGVRL